MDRYSFKGDHSDPTIWTDTVSREITLNVDRYSFKGDHSDPELWTDTVSREITLIQQYGQIQFQGRSL